MNPITPQRFIELMSKTDKRYLKLWHIELEKHFEIKYIWKSDPYVWEGKAYKGGSYLLSKLFEKKPETLYDDLTTDMQCSNYPVYDFHYDISAEKMEKHRCQLESMIIEEVKS